jgi:hypothetical protein
VQKTREYYDRRHLEMINCHPEPLPTRIKVAFDWFVELRRENRFPDLRRQFHALLLVQQRLLLIQEEAHFLRHYRGDLRRR